MDDRHYTVKLSLHRFAESYLVELSHSDPDSQTQVAPVHGVSALNPDLLLPLQLNDEEYGRELCRQLFSDAALKAHFLQVETACQATQSFLRLSVAIDSSAQELQALRWELLRHPETNSLLSSSERLLFSRFLVSRDWRPVQIRARNELVALIAISAPPGEKLQKMELATVDFAGELARVQAALGGVRTRVLGGPDQPFTLEKFVEALREGVDLVYLVSHGMFGRSTGTPALVLQDDSGQVKMVKGEDLCSQLADLQTLPRLVVLASCQSSGDGQQVEPSKRSSVQATLAGRLGDAGVPAIVAMQGYITMDTVEQMMPVFFTELLRDGQIDRALSAARGRVRGNADSWMPALFTRLTTGKLWYTPGFKGEKGKDVWKRLLKPVREGKLVPILGPRLLEAAHGASHQTATRLAGASHFPFAPHERDDLPRVTEYLSVKESRFNVVLAYQDQLLTDLIAQHRHWLPAEEIPPQAKRPKLGKLLAMVGDHLRDENPSDAYRILAELPASVYVTTNFDPLMERALKAACRPPQQVLSRWRYQKAPRPEDSLAEPTQSAPMVYHCFGAFGTENDDGLVLTQDDYFSYLMDTAAFKLFPSDVESALVDNSLLFLGFRLTDWHFRVLFRLMMGLPGKERLKQYCHVAVQLDPDMQTMADVEGAKVFLAEYFGKEANIDIYWGNSEEFLKALRDELAAAGELVVEAPAKEDEDEWNF